MSLNKEQLWYVDGQPLCIDHVLFSQGETGRRCVPDDYVDFFEVHGRRMVCVECQSLHDRLQEPYDTPRTGILHLFLGAGRAERRDRSRRAHPSSRQITWGSTEEEQ